MTTIREAVHPVKKDVKTTGDFVKARVDRINTYYALIDGHYAVTYPYQPSKGRDELAKKAERANILFKRRGSKLTETKAEQIMDVMELIEKDVMEKQEDVIRAETYALMQTDSGFSGFYEELIAELEGDRITQEEFNQQIHSRYVLNTQIDTLMEHDKEFDSFYNGLLDKESNGEITENEMNKRIAERFYDVYKKKMFDVLLEHDEEFYDYYNGLLKDFGDGKLTEKALDEAVITRFEEKVREKIIPEEAIPKTAADKHVGESIVLNDKHELAAFLGFHNKNLTHIVYDLLSHQGMVEVTGDGRLELDAKKYAESEFYREVTNLPHDELYVKRVIVLCHLFKKFGEKSAVSSLVTVDPYVDQTAKTPVIFLNKEEEQMGLKAKNIVKAYKDYWTIATIYDNALAVLHKANVPTIKREKLVESLKKEYWNQYINDLEKEWGVGIIAHMDPRMFKRSPEEYAEFIETNIRVKGLTIIHQKTEMSKKDFMYLVEGIRKKESRSTLMQKYGVEKSVYEELKAKVDENEEKIERIKKENYATFMDEHKMLFESMLPSEVGPAVLEQNFKTVSEKLERNLKKAGIKDVKSLMVKTLPTSYYENGLSIVGYDYSQMVAEEAEGGEESISFVAYVIPHGESLILTVLTAETRKGSEFIQDVCDTTAMQAVYNFAKANGFKEILMLDNTHSYASWDTYEAESVRGRNALRMDEIAQRGWAQEKKTLPEPIIIVSSDERERRKTKEVEITEAYVIPTTYSYDVIG